MKSFCLSVVFLLFIMPPVMSQTQQEITALKQQRFRKIEFYHVGAVMETGGNENWFVSPKVILGIGSFRNLLNMDVGLGYQIINPWGSLSKERISLRQFPFLASLHFNVVRWPTGCIYSGGEFSYSLSVSGFHHLPYSDIMVKDNALGNSHAIAACMFGVRLNHWDFGLSYSYDIAPCMNQKYVFESVEYDYDYLYLSLFERSRIALNISYLFSF